MCCTRAPLQGSRYAAILIILVESIPYRLIQGIPCSYHSGCRARLKRGDLGIWVEALREMGTTGWGGWARHSGFSWQRGKSRLSAGATHIVLEFTQPEPS
jgi:hypothetical protein